MKTISYQLYSSRNAGPLAETLRMLKAAGYGAVEGYGGLYGDVPALKAALDAAGLYGRTYEELSARFHVSYMIGNDQPEHQTDARIREAGLANGYKFEVLSFRVGDAISVVEVRNFGVAPIYYDAFVAVNGVRSAQSLKGLLPGQVGVFTVASGGDDPSLTIESDRLVAGRRIEFRARL